MEHIILQPDPIEVIERTLRDVIHEVLSEKFGPAWTQNEQVGLGTKWDNELTEKCKSDQGVQKPEVVYDIPLAYAEFSDLGKLLEKHKELFASIFTNWEEFCVYYRTVEKLRNMIKHHRDISPTQPALLTGIAGEIEDAVNLWRIGTRLEVKRTVLQFSELISTQNKADDQILRESIECIEQWRRKISSAIEASGLDPHKFDTKTEQFEIGFRGQNIEVKISTAPTASPSYNVEGIPYKGIHSELIYNSGCRAKLDDLLAAIGKPYRHIAYDLVDRIEVEALKTWSTERAGLNPSGSSAFNGELTGIDYSLLGGRLRVGAWKYTDMSNRRGGRLHATFDSSGGFWRAHRLMGPKQLIGFMVGSIAPKAMMHLVRLATLPN